MVLNGIGLERLGRPVEETRDDAHGSKRYSFHNKVAKDRFRTTE